MLNSPKNKPSECSHSPFRSAFRLAILCALVTAAPGFVYGATESSAGGSQNNETLAEIRSKVCGFSGFFSVAEKEGKRFLVMHSGCTTRNGKEVKAEFTPNSDATIEANENAEYTLSDDVYIYFSDGEPILSYVNESGKRVNVMLVKENGVYNMRKYLKYVE